MEAKKQGEEDLSMEEILQSIRRIIADEGDEKPADAAAATSAVSGSASDILELTDMIEEEPAAPVATPDVLNNIDAALAPEPAPLPLEVPEIIVEEKPAAAPEQHEAKINFDEALLSESAQESAISSLNKLKHADEPKAPVLVTQSPTFRSGMTVEDMVAEMLKPMMKEWLDKNLPAIVERIVEREVLRLTRR